jgi:hypothetical protein
MHKHKFGQGYRVDLLKRIHTKFTLYFLNSPMNFYEFSKLETISAN